MSENHSPLLPFRLDPNLPIEIKSAVFDPMSYSREIFEDVSIGSSVVTVTATDLDSGNRGREKNGLFHVFSVGCNYI